MHIRLRILASLVGILASAAFCQQVDLTQGPVTIEEAYRRAPGFGKLQFQRVDRPPYLFFVEAGAPGWLGQLVQQNTNPLALLVKEFDARFGRKLGRDAKHKLAVWVVGNAASYRACGGVEGTSVHFDRRVGHVLALAREGTATQRLVDQRELLRACSTQLLHACKKKDKRPLSPWLEVGISEYLASMPKTANLLGRPILRYPDEKRVRDQLDLIWRSFDWKQTSGLDLTPNPIASLLFADLESYLGAVGVDPKNRDDVEDQMLVLRDSCYATTLMFDLAFRERFRPALLKALELEIAGQRGLSVVERVLDAKVRSRLHAALRIFAAAPTRRFSEKFPPTRVLDYYAGGQLFVEPGAKPVAKPARPTQAEPASVAIVRALAALRDFDFPAARTLAATSSEPIARRVATSAATLEALLGEYDRLARAPGKKVKLYLPTDNPKKPQSCRVLRYDRSRAAIEVQVGKRDPSWQRLAEIPAYRVTNSIFRQRGVTKTAERRRALGVLIALDEGGLKNSTARRNNNYAKKKWKLEDASAALANYLPGIAMLRECKRVENRMRATRKTGVLGELGDKWQATEQGSVADAVARRAVSRLLDAASNEFGGWSSVLVGACEIGADGRVRIVYDWKDAKQKNDWLLIKTKERFLAANFVGGRPSFDVVPEQGVLEFRGLGALRHRLQFIGRVAVEFDLKLKRTKEAGGERITTEPSGNWLLSCLRPRTFVGGGFWGLAAEFSGRPVGGGIKPIAKDKIRPLIERMLKGATFRLERNGGRLELSSGDEVFADYDVSVLPDQGAVVWHHEPTFAGKRDKRAVVGKVVIEGRPHPSSVAVLRREFMSRWRKRFSRLR